MLPRVFVDANVMFSTTLRAWFLNLGTGGASGESPGFELLLSEAVIAEAVARWNDKNPRARGGAVTRMSEAMREVATMVRDYDATIPFPGTDEGDIHVHAAAVASGAGYLVTLDKGFLNLPDEVKDTLTYEIYSPDEFLILASKQSPRRLREVTRETMKRYAKKDGKDSRMVAKLTSAGAPDFAQVVNAELAMLAGVGQPAFDRR